jgi:cation transport ATPase
VAQVERLHNVGGDRALVTADVGFAIGAGAGVAVEAGDNAKLLRRARLT